MPKYDTMLEEEKQKLLRVFIIGNGFDLAHGIKSSYADFTKYYINKLIVKYNEKIDIANDKLFYSRKSSGWRRVEIEEVNLKTIQDELKLQGFDFSVRPDGIMSSFDNFNWADIESNYFKRLVDIYNSLVRHNWNKENSWFSEKIKKINSQLEFFKDKFIEFLNKQDSPFSNEFDSFFKKNSNINVDWREEKFEIGLFDYDYCFLNFNYTQTAKKYIKDKDFFNIHGSLGDIRNPPIFGLGDEYHPIYRDFVELNEAELLENVKSIKYLQANVYKGLMNKLREYDNIEYIVLGHSCGMSDRTLLKELFNMEDKNINIYLYNYEQFKYDDEGKKIEDSGDKGFQDYTNKLYGLSSYFENNQIMRNKVAEFNPDLIMPQLKK